VTAVARSWSRLTLAGKLIFTIVPVLLVLTIGLTVTLVLLGPTILGFLTANLWLVRFVVAATAILLMSVPTATVLPAGGPASCCSTRSAARWAAPRAGTSWSRSS